MSKNIIESFVFQGTVLFLFIFLAFFSSAVGLYNSVDAPQFFTTESILNFRDFDISHFSNSPFYYTEPDVFYRNDHTYNIRGYMVSVLSIPLHWVSKALHSFYNTSWFDAQLHSVTDFSYPLAVTSLFPVFSIIGLYFFWKTAKEVGTDASATITTLILAFGTYIWKYTNTYSRLGVDVAILGISFYLFHKSFSTKNFKYSFLLLVMIAIAFGVDTILFLSLLPALIWSFIKVFSKQKLPSKQQSVLLSIPIVLIGAIIGVNKYVYNSYISIQTLQQPIVKQALQENARKAWMSTPLYPTLYCVLFCAGKIPGESFSNFENFPEEIRTFASLTFAETNNFYGIFTVTPAFFLIVGLLFLRLSDYERTLVGIGMITVAIGVIANAKVLVFWGGNQYDIRYFVPYTLLLGFPVSLFFSKVQKLPGIVIKSFLYLTGLGLAISSIYMGWLGVLAMYLPAETGENRLLVAPSVGVSVIQQIDPAVLFRLTFMNFPNILIGGIVALYILCWCGAIRFAIKHHAAFFNQRYK